MKKVINVLLSIGLIVVMGCKPESLRAPDYIRYMEQENHDCRIRQEIGKYEYTIQLAPASYIVAKEVPPSDSASAVSARRLSELNGMTYFIIRMGQTEESRREQGGDRLAEQQMNVNSMVGYYDQEAARDIRLLLNGNQEIAPSAYVFENNYELSPYNNIVVGFETGEIVQDLKLQFNDRYTKTGMISAYFSKETVSGLPRLKF